MTTDEFQGELRIGRIPVRNLWLLMLYASDLTRFREMRHVLTDETIDDLPDLIGSLLTSAVEHRLRRNLTRGYRRREDTMPRVRGRIDVLATESRQLLSKGEVFCRFEELTIDIPRNRLVRAALERLARLVDRSELAQRCRSLLSSLARAGVSGAPPSRSDLAQNQIGRNDAADRLMVALAELAFNLALPTEDPGVTSLVAPEREQVWVRRLFEKAVLGFARVELEEMGWSVRGATPLQWQVSSSSKTLDAVLPRMVTDIVLDDPSHHRRTVIDTKFTSIVIPGQYGADRLRSGYLYQLYAYIRSQEGLDSYWDGAAGLLLHPAIHNKVYEYAVIQNHMMMFATVDLTLPAVMIRRDLRRLLLGFSSTALDQSN